MLSSFSIASPTSFSPFPKTLISKSSSSSSFHGIKLAHVCPPRIQCTRGVQISPVKMSKKDEELKEIRALSTEEIQEQVVDLKGELFMLRLQRSARNEFKSSDFRRMRKRVCFSLPFFCFFCLCVCVMYFVMLVVCCILVNVMICVIVKVRLWVRDCLLAVGYV